MGGSQVETAVIINSANIFLICFVRVLFDILQVYTILIRELYG